jgi:hypothetical protein
MRFTHIALIAMASTLGAQPSDGDIPKLRKQGTATQLVVDGKPFLILGGELGNSTASDIARMRPMWTKLHAMNLNTVIAPVYWEFLEPREGQFDFTLVDSLIAQARANDMRLVLLWFGSWKNSMSSYVPEYVKLDQARFPRTEATRGQGQEILSPFHSANWEADARAFAALMRHLRTFDGTKHTVLMVQVENETGMIPEARAQYRASCSTTCSAIANRSHPSCERSGIPPAINQAERGKKSSDAACTPRSSSWRGTSRGITSASRPPASASIPFRCTPTPPSFAPGIYLDDT